MAMNFIVIGIFPTIFLKKSFITDFIFENPLLIAIILAIVVIVGGISWIFSKKKSTPSDIIEEKWINDAGLLLYEKLKVKYNNNESLSMLSIVELTDLSIINMESVNAKFEVLPGKTSLRLWACIEWLDDRYKAESTPLNEISEAEAMTKYSINLNENEILHSVFEDVVWYELKSSRTRSFNYHGLGLRIPLGAGFSYRVGTIGALNPDSLEEYKKISSGIIFLTNFRIILQGDAENKSIIINSVLDIEQYKDCIIIGKTSGKKPLVKFTLDDAAIFSRIISRIF